MYRKLFVIAMLGLFGVSLAACNTTEGAGEDMEEAGESVQDVAE